MRTGVLHESIYAKGGIHEGCSTQAVLEEALLAGMSVAGDESEKNRSYTPEVPIAPWTTNRAMQIPELLLAPRNIKGKGIPVLGMVKGDRGDIGENLVPMM